MTVLNRDFYPSPESVVRKMCSHLDLGDGYSGRHSESWFVLDPAAGDGRVLEHIQKVSDRYCVPHLYACEIEPELASVIESKGFPVMAGDFLEYNPTIQFDYIVTNPPFSIAAKFLVHAWEIIEKQARGTLILVLPKTILEENDRYGALANTLIQAHGVKDGATGLPYEDLGKPFARSERPTDVECILVKLVRNPDSAETLDFDYRNDVDTGRFKGQFAEQERGVMPAGFIARKIAVYGALLDHFAQYRTAHKKMVSLLGEFENDVERDDHGNRDGTILKASEMNTGDTQAWNVFYEMLTEAAWNGILDHPDLQRAMTTRAKSMITEFRRSKNRLDFTEGNIRSMFEALVAKSDDLLRQCVFDSFDRLTKYSWENKVHVEGWKSNKSYMVNTRCVLPYVVETRWGSWNVRYGSVDELNDIDKGLCVIMGLPVGQLNVYKCPACGSEKIAAYDSNDDKDGGRALLCSIKCAECKAETTEIRSISRALDIALKHGSSGTTCYSHFFRMRVFKKGTAHLYFRDMEVWQKFNCTASRLRGWLPDDTSYERLKVKRHKKAEKPSKKYAGYQPYYDPDNERMAEDMVVEILPKLAAGKSEKPASLPAMVMEPVGDAVQSGLFGA